MNNVTLENIKVVKQPTLQARDLDYLHVQKSKIQGLGLFTTQYIPANEVLFRIKGKRVYKKYDAENAPLNPNWLGTGYQEWLEIEEGDIGIFVNHSCKPNVILNEHLEFISIKPISKKEELLLDYSTTELDPYWSMQCNCGEECCRKTLLSFQYLPLNLQKEYSRYLSRAFVDGCSL